MYCFVTKSITSVLTLMDKIKLSRKECGFTLIELLIAVAILGTITGVMSMAIVAIYKITPQNNDYARAFQQTQSAGYWIASDVKMAKAIDITPTAPAFLSFTIPISTTDNKIVTYEFENMEGGMKQLFRDDSGTGEQILIAEHIYYNPDSDPVKSTKVSNYDTENRVLKVQITAVSGDIWVTRDYQANQRVTSDS